VAVVEDECKIDTPAMVEKIGGDEDSSREQKWSEIEAGVEGDVGFLINLNVLTIMGN